jgi:hypothetical protein
LSARLWYLRRGVAWLPVLACCAAAAVTALLMLQWPDSAGVLAPTVLACCAGAAAFVYDEDALPVVAVTPRGASWRRATRLAALLLPLAVWAVVVALRPGHVPLARPGWWLLGGATVLLVAGSGDTLGDVQLGEPLPDRRLLRHRADGVAGGRAQRRCSLCRGPAAGAAAVMHTPPSALLPAPSSGSWPGVRLAVRRELT